jgi:hypothetical protein
MATLESIEFEPHRAKILASGGVEWLPQKNREIISQLPQIIWNDASPWREANLWACLSPQINAPVLSLFGHR